MNYIRLNGIKSTEFQGLLIQELPPITKPEVRTNTEVIDGRDGDIITRLGYAAYDKVLTIGLKSNADINDIIGYFANESSGEVEFSNEPDIYYRYDILSAIDFERLVRFKQATVTFHVQPFKYSLAEGNTDLYVSSGEIIPVVNSGNIYSKPILTIRGYGNCTVILNGNTAFEIAFSTTAPEEITIDTEAMEAYSGSVLKNRAVTGDYSKFIFNVGKNYLRFTGAVSKVFIKNYSRWI